MQRLELKDHRELGSSSDLVFNNVAGDFRRKRERKSHNLNFLCYSFNGQYRGIQLIGIGSDGRGISLEKPSCSWQKKVERRDAFGRIDASAARYHQQQGQK